MVCVKTDCLQCSLFFLCAAARITPARKALPCQSQILVPPLCTAGEFIPQSANRFVGNFSPYLWCLLEIPSAQEKRVLDLGPELVDEAWLFIKSNGEWTLHDQAGKTVLNSQKKIQGVRCALEIPARKSEVLLRIKNSDTAAMVFRLFSHGDYFLQTTKFNIVHGMSIAMFLTSMCMQILIWVFRKPRNALFILAVTIFFFIYQLCMKGIGPALLWNSLSGAGFFLHLSYIVATFGFVTILVLAFRCLNLETQFSINNQINSSFIGCALLFAIMFSISPNFDFVYRLSICVLIAGLVFEIIVIAFGARKRKYDFSILIPWCVFYVFLIFRQGFHLIRKSKEYFFLSALMDNDYYFSYDINFLIVNILYLFIMARRTSHPSRLEIERKIQRTQTLSSSYAEKAGTQKISSPSAEIILMEYGLTPREIEVAKMLCSNRNTTKEISQSLNISVNTAATHIKHIYEKCAVNSKFSLYRLINDEITQSGDERSEGKIT